MRLRNGSIARSGTFMGAYAHEHATRPLRCLRTPRSDGGSHVSVLSGGSTRSRPSRDDPGAPSTGVVPRGPLRLPRGEGGRRGGASRGCRLRFSSGRCLRWGSAAAVVASPHRPGRFGHRQREHPDHHLRRSPAHALRKAGAPSLGEPSRRTGIRSTASYAGATSAEKTMTSNTGLDRARSAR
jgi:hypothetical protein